MSDFLNYAMTFLGIPYIYGGKSRLTGLDCSGFVMECLEAFGFLEGELNAQQIHAQLITPRAPAGIFTRSHILFFGKSKTEITHIAIGLSPFLMIECGGGDHTTLTKEDAAKRRAGVRIRPIAHRKDLIDILAI